MSILTKNYKWVWAGASKEDEFKVTAKLLDSNSVNLRLAVSTVVTLASPIYFDAINVVNGIVKFNPNGLIPDTTYFYAPESDGIIDKGRLGKCRTAPNGTRSFSFGFGGCSGGLNANQVYGNRHIWNAIAQSDIDFFLHLGDLFYEDSKAYNLNTWQSFYDNVMIPNRPRQLFRKVPIIYMPDNHDWLWEFPQGKLSGNNRQYPRQAYQDCVPHYDLPAGSGNMPLYQTFSWGRVRFIITDSVSERDDYRITDDASKSYLGITQKEWLKDTLLNATEPVICWVQTSAPWIGPGDASVNDRWPNFEVERTEIVDFINNNGLSSKMFMVCSDAHMLAYDDGTNTPGGFPLFHAGPMERGGAPLGGPYSGGISAPQFGTQFGLVTVTDTGTNIINISFSGRQIVRWYESQAHTEVMAYNYNVNI